MDGAPVWTQLGTSPRGRGVKNRKQRLSEGSKVFASMGSWAGNGKPEVSHSSAALPSFSTCGHCCRMKRLSTARVLRVLSLGSLMDEACCPACGSCAEQL